ASLTQQTASQNPLVVEPDIDCGSISSASELDDPAITFSDAALHNGEIIFSLRMTPADETRSYGVAVLQESTWQLDAPAALESSSTLFPAHVLTVGEKLAIFWPTKTTSGIAKNMSWREGEQWVPFNAAVDDQVTHITLATDFDGRVYVWG